MSTKICALVEHALRSSVQKMGSKKWLIATAHGAAPPYVDSLTRDVARCGIANDGRVASTISQTQKILREEEQGHPPLPKSTLHP